MTKIKKEFKKLNEWMVEYYGKRCPEYEKDCACCEAWELYDKLIWEVHNLNLMVTGGSQQTGTRAKWKHQNV